MKPNQKLDELDVQMIRVFHRKKIHTMKELAFMFKVVPQTISRIIGRKRRAK